MAKEIETFYWQRFVPEEGRGGDYHIVINEDGVLSDVLTPTQADARGFQLDAIFADIDRQMALAVDQARAETTRAREAAEIMRAEKDAQLAAGALAVAGASDILDKVARRVSKEIADEIRADIEALNARINAAADPVRVAPVDAKAEEGNGAQV